MSKPTVVILGILGRTPFAGVAWQLLHFLEGFRACGYDAYYVEDTGTWPYDRERNTVSADCGFTVRYIGGLMERLGLGDRWAYRAASMNGQVFGLSSAELDRLIERAAAIVNLTGATILRDEHLRVPVRIYLETDPVLPQIEVAEERAFTIDLLRAHTHHFTFGERIGSPTCEVPALEFTYQPTRQPIVLDWWRNGDVGRRAEHPFTTIASWRQTDKDICWKGQTLTWSKHHEFMKVIDLPQRSGRRFELALAALEDADQDLLRSYGWAVIDALALSSDPDSYREFIRTSRGEFTVAKEQNVRLRSGWFSDRSACYLAAGRPVITQETGFSELLPTGRGLFGFLSEDEVLAALDAIEADYDLHSRAAEEIAEEYFGADRVVSQLARRAGL